MKQDESSTRSDLLAEARRLIGLAGPLANEGEPDFLSWCLAARAWCAKVDNEAVSERPRWIPLSERLPTEADSYGGDVLTLSGTGQIGAQHWKHVAAMVADAKLNNEECYYAFWHRMPTLPPSAERPEGSR